MNEYTLLGFLKSMGPIAMWVMSILFAVLIFMIGKKAYDLFLVKKGSYDKNKREVDIILSLGVACAVFGIFMQIAGIWSAIKEIIRAADVSMQIIFEGIRISFHSTVYGFIILIVAYVFWFPFNQMVLKSKSSE